MGGVQETDVVVGAVCVLVGEAFNFGEQFSHRRRLSKAHCKLVLIRSCQSSRSKADDRVFESRLSKSNRRLNPAHTGQVTVHHYHIWLVGESLRQGVRSVCSDDKTIARAMEIVFYQREHILIIIANKYAY